MAAKKRKANDKKADKESAKNKPSKGAKLSRKEYEAEIEKLHAELVKLQYWVTTKGLKVVVLFEGRDAAGKGGVIKRITERVSPRIFRVVALPAPSEREKTQLYFQRYINHFPAAGEIVIFDRSWYNRAGVERVMGFCSRQEYERFLRDAPEYERAMVDEGIILIKYWFDVGMDEQARRFRARIDDPRKVWKLSPMDLESYRRWYQYSTARDHMLAATDTDWAPWCVVRADSKRRARLNCISHFLGMFDYEELPREKVELGKRDLSGSYDDVASLEGRTFIPEKY